MLEVNILKKILDYSSNENKVYIYCTCIAQVDCICVSEEINAKFY